MQTELVLNGGNDPEVIAALLPPVREERDLGRDPQPVGAAARARVALGAHRAGLLTPGLPRPELLTAVRARARWVPDDALALVHGAAPPRRSGAAHE